MGPKHEGAQYVFTGIAVTDYATSAAWFEKLFGRAPDVVVEDGVECMWEMRDGAWVYIVVDNKRAGQALVMISVHDLSAVLNEISARGLGEWSTEVRPGVFRKAVFTDPDGNAVTFAKLAV